MIESIKGVKNPLTIIAIFAGLAEISGTGILPFIAESNQSTYIWFLMIFPVVLVVFFFLTLNFNPKVLYSPSDFRDEANYMKIFEPSSVAQKLLKIQEEVEEGESEDAKNQTRKPYLETQPKLVKSQVELLEMMKKDSRTRYQLAEILVIDRLTKELGIQPQRDLSLRNSPNKVMYDAVFNRSDGITVVEVKFFSNRISMIRMSETIKRIEDSLQRLPLAVQRNAHLILAIAHEMPEEHAEIIKRDLENITANSRITIEVRMFSMSDLMKEVEI